MSQKITKKKRLKTAQKMNDLLMKEDSKIAEFFKDYLTFVPDILINNQSRLNDVPQILLENGEPKPTEVSKTLSSPLKNNECDSLALPKWKATLSQSSHTDFKGKNKNNRYSLKSQKSVASLKNNANNLFDNVTASFTSSKILSLRSPSKVDDPKRFELSSWGLPSTILEKYKSRGIGTMFPWQVECLANRKILEENRNLVYSAPTSAGKTLVAEFLVLKTVLERRKKAIFILPFVSVVREKMFYFQELLSDSGVRVEGFMGGVAPPGGFSAVHLAIATIEKANSLINRLMEEGDLVTLGAVVIDELHLLGDQSRGYILELLLTKLRYMTLSLENINIQLIGMSATLPNLPSIAEWLDAELYKTDFRPIPLNEQCKIDRSILDCKMKVIRELEAAPEIANDTDNIIQLCIETISGGHGVLIFCPTKSWCEKLSSQIAYTFFQLGRDNTAYGEILRKNMDEESLEEVLIQLSHCPVGLDNVLKKTVSFGVAFHHAGLTMDERDIIEGGFRVGAIKVLVATSTLSCGVNLPARRVIVRSPKFNSNLLDKLTYQQMIGRAGRMGKDTAGESILVCQPNERTLAQNLMAASLEPIESCLECSGPLIRALLEAIASEIVRTPKDLDFYCKCTFVYKCEESEVTKIVEEAVQFLIANEFLLVKESGEKEERMVATCLGKACLAASIPPREGLFLFEELQRARKCLVLDTELHVVYLVTPFSSGSQIGQIDWMSFMELWRMLSESERRVGQLVGVEERFLMSAMRGIAKPGKKLNIHRRFYTALALHDLVREIPLNVVCRKYNCCRGLLQSLQQSSSTFAGMVTNFCKELKWDCMELLFAQFQARLQFGVGRDLLDLLRLQSLNGLRARSLFKHGIETVTELAVAGELCVEEALNKALPFESEKNFDGENATEIAKRTKMRTVFITGKDGLTAREAARIVIEEARILVKNELGLRNVQWSQVDSSSTRADSTGLRTSTKNNPDDEEPMDIERNEDATTGKMFSIDKRMSRSSDSIFASSSGSINQNDKMRRSSGILEFTRGEKYFSERSKILSLSCGNGIGDNIEFGKTAKILRSEDKIDAREKTNVDVERKKIANDRSDFYENKENLSVFFKDTINGNNESKLVERITNDAIAKKKTDEDPKDLLKNGAIVSIPLEDAISKGDESKSISKVLEGTKSSLKDDPITIRTLDFTEAEAEAKKSRVESNSEKDKDIVPIPPPKICAIANEWKNRVSADSNYSKSPSLFSDSSFLDPQMCSILEKNVIDSECFADFEKSNFTPRNESPVKLETSKVADNRETDDRVNETSTLYKTRTNENAWKDSERTSIPLTWIEDSWDQIKNQRSSQMDEKPKSSDNNGIKEKSESESPSSPSFLKRTLPRERLRPGITGRTVPNKIGKLRAKSSKDETPDVTSWGTPKSILRKRAFDNNNSEGSPVAGVRSYNTRRPFVPSNTRSDSDDSILNSQKIDPSKTNVNKTRLRIEQKLGKSMKIKDTNSKVLCSAPKLLKQNTEPDLENGNSSSDDIDDVESYLMFESNDKSKTRAKKPKKIIGNTATVGKTKPLKDVDRRNANEENLNLKATEPINVANSRRTFRLFRREIEGSPEIERRKDLAIAIVTEDCARDPAIAIGNRIIGAEDKKKDRKLDTYVYKDKKICGIVISWGAGTTYYMPFGNSQDTKITIKERTNFLRNILTNPSVTLRCFNAKEVYKMLYLRYEIEFYCGFLDPNMGDWMMNSDSCNKSYSELAARYFPKALDITDALENNFGKYFINSSARASAKALLAWYITGAVLDSMEEQNSSLLPIFKEIEMPAILVLANMELKGLGINSNSLQELSAVIKSDLFHTEEKAFRLAGRKFNFYSSKEVSQVLGLNRKGRNCTNKVVLRSCENPISNLVTLWRKLNTVQTKIVFPLLQLEKKNNRIHGSCITRTVTGRISMHDPNLQTIPRDFESEVSNCVLSVRMAFVPDVGNAMLSADFCQLELRILAHYSEDPVLRRLMHEKGDIFRNIAARLNRITEDAVNDDMRQRAKQLCYAMIYGMGTKSLAETLSVTESEAKDYLEAFMGTYKGIRVWLNTVFEEARINGFVSTLTNRRRVLPGINSKIPAIKSQAERQAVNTKVQGTAADITKKAMVLIENKLREKFSLHLPLVSPITQSTRKLRYSGENSKPRSAYLVLQLHDELLYEVNSSDLAQVAAIVKESMEHAYELSVPLPVKMKVGTAWGNLEEYQV